MASEAKLHTPAFERNAAPILAVLRRVLPASGLVLEVASGSGQHARHLAEALPALRFQPSDPDAERRASIDAWAEGQANILPALDLDAAAAWAPMPEAVAAVLCINMIHISPWQATEGLIRNAARLLPPGGVLITYGAYLRHGVATAASNLAFDADLRARNPLWGLRSVEAVADCAAAQGFGPPEIFEMPANNLLLVFRRTE